MSPGHLSFTKLVMISPAPAKSAGDARYASQDPFIQSTLSHIISTPICIRSTFFHMYVECSNHSQLFYVNFDEQISIMFESGF